MHSSVLGEIGRPKRSQIWLPSPPNQVTSELPNKLVPFLNSFPINILGMNVIDEFEICNPFTLFAELQTKMGGIFAFVSAQSLVECGNGVGEVLEAAKKSLRQTAGERCSLAKVALNLKGFISYLKVD